MNKNKIHAALAASLYWAIDRKFAESQIPALEVTDASAVIKAEEPSTVKGEDDVCYIPIRGVMMKHESSWGGGCSTVATRRSLRRAANDPNCSKIVLLVDSPGGSVDGTADLADDIVKVKATKPVVAYIEGMCCSAALWVASQCTQVVCSPNVLSVGSIGVYTVWYDTSKAYEEAGISPILISSGGIKGQPVSGLPIPEEVIDECQAMITHIRDVFASAVATGRGMDVEDVLLLADGRTWRASEAESLGLVDRIASWDDFLEEDDEDDAPEPDEVGGRAETMNILDRIIGKRAKASVAADPPIPVVDNPLANPLVAEIVEMKISATVEGFVSTKKIPTGSQDAAEELFAAIVDQEGITVSNNKVEFGAVFGRAEAFIESLEAHTLDTPVISGAAAVESDGKKPNPADESARKRAQARRDAEANRK
jgi:signal peptide peptidase SppA